MDNVLAKNIKQLRQCRELTQADLAAKIGTSRTQIIKYESGKQIPGGLAIWSLAKALEVEPGELFK